MKDKLLSLIKGTLLGMALIIPGISAGTMALITGLYSPIISFLSNIQDTVFKRQLAKTSDLFFQLIPVFIGVLLGLILSIQWVYSLITMFPLFSYSFFSGVILASIPFLLKQTTINIRSAWILFLCTLISFSLSYFNPVSLSSYFWIFLSVYLAALAMILPGTSGSYILILMGTYTEVLEILKSFSTKSLLIIGIAVFSLLSCSKLIQHLLNRYKNYTMISLTGLTLGGGMGVFPLKSIEAFQQKGIENFILLFMGIFLVFIVQYLWHYFSSRRIQG
ncbi:MAG: DUF368 domain-containing protein [Bdellovibrionales bacterium]|nr:DUF368 domain-containing protein [Bdellovibrionales bacterium]